jgi:hypothetical protein
MLFSYAVLEAPRPGSRVSSPALQPDWLPLDNAAKIYPAASSKLSPALFRLSARLRAPVRLSALQRAADALVRRCPYFQVYLRRGLFWYYLQRHRETPRVQLLDSLPMEAMPARGRAEHLLRIRGRIRTRRRPRTATAGTSAREVRARPATPPLSTSPNGRRGSATGGSSSGGCRPPER